MEEVKAYSCDECLAFGKGVSKFPEDEQEEFCEIVAELLPASPYPSTLYQDQCLDFLWRVPPQPQHRMDNCNFGCCQVQGLCLDRGTPVGGTCAFDFNCVTPPRWEQSKLRVQKSEPYRNMPVGTIQFNLCSNIRLCSHCWNDSTACRVSRVPVSTVNTVYYYSIVLFLAFDSVAYNLLSLGIRNPLTQHCV